MQELRQLSFLCLTHACMQLCIPHICILLSYPLPFLPHPSLFSLCLSQNSGHSSTWKWHLNCTYLRAMKTSVSPERYTDHNTNRHYGEIRSVTCIHALTLCIYMYMYIHVYVWCLLIYATFYKPCGFFHV